MIFTPQQTDDTAQKGRDLRQRFHLANRGVLRFNLFFVFSFFLGLFFSLSYSISSRRPLAYLI